MYKMKRYEPGFFKEITSQTDYLINQVKLDFTGAGEMANAIVDMLKDTIFGISGDDDSVVDVIYSEATNKKNKLMFFVVRSRKNNDELKLNNTSLLNSNSVKRIVFYDYVHNKYERRGDLSTYTLSYNCRFLNDYNDEYTGVYHLLPFTDYNLGAFEGIYICPFLIANGQFKTYAITEISDKEYCMTTSSCDRYKFDTSVSNYPDPIILYEAMLD